MKKHSFPILLIITFVFTAFTLGFFLGRNCSSSGDILVSNVQRVPQYGTESPIEPASSLSSTVEDVIFPLNINTATQLELVMLPGIGEILAQRILNYRNEHGDFAATAELLNVEGIGTTKLEAILDLITTGG